MSVVRDFDNAEASVGRVSAEMFAGVLARIADMAMVLDADGRVRDVAFGPSDLAGAGFDRLVGERLIDLVTSESEPKVAALLDGSSVPGRWRHVNFPVAAGDDIPVSLQAFGLGGGRLLVAGRDERQNAVIQRRFVDATRELERAHARQRQLDLRLQTMLALSGLAMLTLDGETLAIIDASPAAVARLGGSPVGSDVASLFSPEDAATIRDTLIRATGSGRIVELDARLRDGIAVGLQAAMFRHERASRLLVRIDADLARSDVSADLVAALPQALVVTDRRLLIEHVNRAFVDQTQLSLAANALGQSLERFIGRGGVDTGILVAALREEPLVRGFVSILTGAFGTSSEVEIDAVRLPDDRFGFLIRPVRGDRRARALDVRDRAGLAERMTEVVGRVALKDIVRDTTDVIERLCIETALELTDNNRAAASEMLGISRQSLYAKLARYGIGSTEPESD